MLFMSEVLKVAQYIHYKDCNALYVKGVKSSLINFIRTVLLLCRRCQKTLQMVLHICAYNFLNI